MHLTQFPAAIHTSQLNLLRAEQLLRPLQATVDHLTAKIEYEIAFDPELKNDAQRKARRIELSSTPDYIQAVEALQVVKDGLEAMKVNHKLLVDRFSVCKLEKCEAIIAMELRSNAA